MIAVSSCWNFGTYRTLCWFTRKQNAACWSEQCRTRNLKPEQALDRWGAICQPQRQSSFAKRSQWLLFLGKNDPHPFCSVNSSQFAARTHDFVTLGCKALQQNWPQNCKWSTWNPHDWPFWTMFSFLQNFSPNHQGTCAVSPNVENGDNDCFGTVNIKTNPNAHQMALQTTPWSRKCCHTWKHRPEIEPWANNGLKIYQTVVLIPTN